MEDQQQGAAVQNMFREVLMRRGFHYCDHGVPQDTDPLPEDLKDEKNMEVLIETGVSASSTDDPTQSIRKCTWGINRGFCYPVI